MNVRPTQDGKESKIASFIGGDLDNDLSTVPGVGPATVKALGKAGVTTTRQLIGKFLMLTKDGDDTGKAAAVRLERTAQPLPLVSHPTASPLRIWPLNHDRQ